MYLASRQPASAESLPQAAEKDKPSSSAVVPARVPVAVIALGLVSFFTDASAELVSAFLPVYLLYQVGVSYLQFGLIDGIYTGATVLLRILGGQLADRWGKPKEVALIGYGLSAATKAAFPFLGTAMASVGALVAVDRAGKGLRTAPRDAMIAAASPPRALGRTFGVHRAWDTAGALVGPLLAFALLAGLGGQPTVMFGVSCCLAVVGVLILAFFVPNPIRVRQPDPASVPVAVPASAVPVSPWRHREVRRAAGYVAVLGLATAGDAFLYTALVTAADIGTQWLLLMPLGTAMVFLLTAVPLGRFADRWGRWRVFLGGHVLLAAAYTVVAAATSSVVVLPIVLILHGLYYAATDGVLSAHVGAFLPADSRARGVAFVQSAQALARMVAAVCLGALAGWVGLEFAFGGFAAALAVIVTAASIRERRQSTTSHVGEGA